MTLTKNWCNVRSLTCPRQTQMLRGGQPRDFDVVKQASTPMAHHPGYVCFFFPPQIWLEDGILWNSSFYCNSYPVIQICRHLVNDLPNLRLKWMQMQTPQVDGIRWVLMDWRPRPNIEHHVSNEPNSPIIHKLRHVAPFVSCLLHGWTILVRRFGGQNVLTMEDFKFVSSQDVVDRSYSTSATNQKRGGSGVSSVVGKPAQWRLLLLQFCAHIIPLSHLTCSHFYMFSILQLHKLDSRQILLLQNHAKRIWRCLKIYCFSNKTNNSSAAPVASRSGPKRKEDHPAIGIRAEALRSTEWDRLGFEFSRMPNIEIAILLSMSLWTYCSILFLWEDCGRCFHGWLPHVLHVRDRSCGWYTLCLDDRWWQMRELFVEMRRYEEHVHLAIEDLSTL